VFEMEKWVFGVRVVDFLHRAPFDLVKDKPYKYLGRLHYERAKIEVGVKVEGDREIFFEDLKMMIEEFFRKSPFVIRKVAYMYVIGMMSCEALAQALASFVKMKLKISDEGRVIVRVYESDGSYSEVRA